MQAAKGFLLLHLINKILQAIKALIKRTGDFKGQG